MSPPIDEAAFEKLRRIVPNQLASRRDPEEWRAQSLPEEIAFKLTNRCDLRCTHCYQWNDDGYHRRLPRVEQQGDLPLAIIDKVLASTQPSRANVFLWGGEPLVYRYWDELVDRLVAAERWTSICTNGTLIEPRMPSLIRLADRVEMSVSIDGFEREHDALRGVGTWARTMSGLRLLVAQKRTGHYRGEISANCVISDELIPRLPEFVAFIDDVGVETFYLSFPWYISPQTAARMDACFAERFPERHIVGTASWHSYTHKLDPMRVDELREALARIDAMPVRSNLRYNPALSDVDLADFIGGSDKPAQGKTRCLALRTRLDVFPSGEAISCKFFPEFSVGNLTDADVEDVWRSEGYDRVRQSVTMCGLMPVCAKCNLLYTRGA